MHNTQRSIGALDIFFAIHGRNMGIRVVPGDFLFASSVDAADDKYTACDFTLLHGIVHSTNAVRNRLSRQRR